MAITPNNSILAGHNHNQPGMGIRLQISILYKSLENDVGDAGRFNRNLNRYIRQGPDRTLVAAARLWEYRYCDPSTNADRAMLFPLQSKTGPANEQRYCQ